jgi:AraC family transcriptional regulator
MSTTPDILAIASSNAVTNHQMTLLQEKQQQIPGAIHYTIRRYWKQNDWQFDDTGMMVYHYNAKNQAENYLELRFCMAGNRYCREKDIECNHCRLNESARCIEKFETVDVMSFRFTPAHLSQFVSTFVSDTLAENIFRFSHTAPFSKMLPLCGRSRMVLDGLLNHTYTGSFENIYFNAQTQMLLLYSFECMVGEKIEQFRCKFLSNEADREKIVKAREILLQHIGEPLTIKALSRKVAINECYLKKGFKELFGQTIFDFYQSQRMEHAKYLLYEKSLSVTDVSSLLGYSSISHFSTAFKKHTGLKPCELLVH